MSKEIAVVTVSGRAYYRLSTELRKRSVPFLSLVDLSDVPPHVKVVISTERKESDADMPVHLVYNEQDDPSEVVTRAIQIAGGRATHDQVCVGVDPGKSVGIVVVGDHGIILQTTCASVETSVETIIKLLESTQADRKVVKVGDGGGRYRVELLELLNAQLPPEAALEIVDETGTSRGAGDGWKMRRPIRDMASAAVISMRSGKAVERGQRSC